MRLQSERNGTILRGRMRFLQTLVAIAVFALLLGTPRIASANGRYPQATQLVQDPRDAKRLWLLTTYGLLTSANGGETWHWICEEALGFSSSSVFDPTFAVHEDGTLMIGLLTGLRTSASQGCAWQDAVPAIKGNFVLDVTVHAREKRRSLALVSYGETADGAAKVRYVNQIWKSADNGKTFTLLAENLPANVFSSTLEVAPCDPSRLYLTGHVYETTSGETAPVLYRSKNEGKSWSQLPIPLPSGTGTFIAAVHPERPDVLYVRSLERAADGKVKSALLYSQDAGSKWRSVFTGEAPMMGFALSLDGSEVFVGLGDPGDRQTSTRAGSLGLWRASTSAFEFQKVFDKSVSCLLATREGLYACSRLAKEGFDLGFSTDGGRTFKTLQRRDAIAGPLPCPHETGFDAVCPSYLWQDLCKRTLGCSSTTATADGGAPVPATADEANEAGKAHELEASRAPSLVHVGIAALVAASAIGLWALVRRVRRAK